MSTTLTASDNYFQAYSLGHYYCTMYLHHIYAYYRTLHSLTPPPHIPPAPTSTSALCRLTAGRVMLLGETPDTHYAYKFVEPYATDGCLALDTPRPQPSQPYPAFNHHRSDGRSRTVERPRSERPPLPTRVSSHPPKSSPNQHRPPSGQLCACARFEHAACEPSGEVKVSRSSARPERARARGCTVAACAVPITDRIPRRGLV